MIISHNTILIPSVSELYGLGALIFFTLLALIILEKTLSQKMLQKVFGP